MKKIDFNPNPAGVGAFYQRWVEGEQVKLLFPPCAPEVISIDMAGGPDMTSITKISYDDQNKVVIHEIIDPRTVYDCWLPRNCNEFSRWNTAPSNPGKLKLSVLAVRGAWCIA